MVGQFTPKFESDHFVDDAGVQLHRGVAMAGDRKAAFGRDRANSPSQNRRPRLESYLTRLVSAIFSLLLYALSDKKYNSNCRLSLITRSISAQAFQDALGNVEYSRQDRGFTAKGAVARLDQIGPTHVLCAIRLSRHFVIGMRERNWGRIVFVSSESAIHIPVEMIHYGMTKTAQLAVSRGLAESLQGTAVTVNAILPGPTSSEDPGESEWLAIRNNFHRAADQRRLNVLRTMAMHCLRIGVGTSRIRHMKRDVRQAPHGP
jgi:hypothetical protein